MPDYKLPYFGLINRNNVLDYYDVIIDFKGREVSIDMNFDKTSIERNLMVDIKDFLENIEKYDIQNLKYIDDDYTAEDGHTVKQFVTEHVEDYGNDFLEELDIDLQGNKEKQFMDLLHLVRIGLYPDKIFGISYFAVFDYTVSQDLTDQIIAVNTDEKGNLDHIVRES